MVVKYHLFFNFFLFHLVKCICLCWLISLYNLLVFILLFTISFCFNLFAKNLYLNYLIYWKFPDTCRFTNYYRFLLYILRVLFIGEDYKVFYLNYILKYCVISEYFYFTKEYFHLLILFYSKLYDFIFAHFLNLTVLLGK